MYDPFCSMIISHSKKYDQKKMLGFNNSDKQILMSTRSLSNIQKLKTILNVRSQHEPIKENSNVSVDEAISELKNDVMLLSKKIDNMNDCLVHISTNIKSMSLILNEVSNASEEDTLYNERIQRARSNKFLKKTESIEVFRL